jgi:hypothetical protein
MVFFTAAGPAMLHEARPNEAVPAQAATGRAGVVDLKTAPELPNPGHPSPINPDRTLHNNISMANHLAAKKKAAGARPTTHRHSVN